MKNRPASKNSEPPPDYGAGSRLFTLCLHYGGAFTSGRNEWVGGEVTKFDYAEFPKLSLPLVKGFVDVAIKCGPRSVLYSRLVSGEKYFPLKCDSQLKTLLENPLNTARELNLYIVEEKKEDGGVDGEVDDQSDEDDLSSGDSSDSDFDSDSDSDSDSDLDSDGSGERIRKRQRKGKGKVDSVQEEPVVRQGKGKVDSVQEEPVVRQGKGKVDSVQEEPVVRQGKGRCLLFEEDLVIDRESERQRKGKSILVEEVDSDRDGGLHSLEDDSDFRISSHDSGEDDNLYHKHVDLEAEWFGETRAEVENEHHSREGVGNQKGNDPLGGEDLVESENDFRSIDDDDDSGCEGRRVPVYSEALKYSPVFHLGMIFATKKEFRELVDSHSIIEKRSVLFTKSDKKRIYAKCADPECPFKIYLRRRGEDSSYEITTLFSEHTCVTTYHVKNMNSNWLIGRYGQQFKSDKKRNVEGFRQTVVTEVRCDVSWWQAYRAKRLTLKAHNGSAEEQYGLLWSYANEIKRTNPGSTVLIGAEQVQGQNKFSRFYVCLSALKEGFLSACRPLFGIDGTFLKGPYGGILLCAVGIDPNNNLYPFAWAVVSKEDGANWGWFVRQLKDDLGIENDYGWTIVSDKQKGLIRAIEMEFPNAAHRFCVSHMHSNFMNAGFRGQAFKTALWRAAKATTVNEFGRRMEDIKRMDVKAYEWLKDKHPEQWSRSHFSTHPKCDTLLNNMCESFNALIIPARELPILSMLEAINSLMIKRIVECRELGDVWKGPYCPRIQQVIDFNTSKIPDCVPIKSSDMHYQISCFDGSQYAVDLEAGTCGCRKWDLTGIPCKHAMSAISCQKLGLDRFVHNYYKVETYREAYRRSIMPMNGRTEWPQSDAIPPLPPKLIRQAGRPPKARRRDANEVVPGTKRKQRGRPPLVRDAHHTKRRQISLTCGACGRIGHNKRSCERRGVDEAAHGGGSGGVDEAAHQGQEHGGGLDEAAHQGQEHGGRVDEAAHQGNQVGEDVLQSQLTQLGALGDDDINIDDAYLKEIEDIIAMHSAPEPEKAKEKNQVRQRKLKIRAPGAFVGDQPLPTPHQRPAEPSTLGPIVNKNGKKYLMLSNRRHL